MRPGSRFAIPGGAPAEVLERLDAEALGLARARVAARLGHPDPFHLRQWLGSATGPVVATPGLPLSPDAADAVLVRAAVETGADPGLLAGLFAGRPAGAQARAVGAPFPCFRFPRERPPTPVRIGRVDTWSCADIGEPPNATVRAVVAIPGGVALGTDYGLVLHQGGQFRPFPWPEGARREARRVEAMAVHGGELLVATSQSLVRWNFRSDPTVKKHGADAEGGWDELRCMLSSGHRLFLGWRTRLEGGDGPPDTFALCEAAGVVYAGTAGGDIYVVDGGRQCSLAPGRPAPVRHLAYADGRLHAAAGGQHQQFDGVTWRAAAPEPTAFAVDRWARVWSLAEGRLFATTRAGAWPAPLPLDRPWCLGASGDSLWIGGRERLWRVEIG